jgi:hypothetical protein
MVMLLSFGVENMGKWTVKMLEATNKDGEIA